jgi:hypothetical protein
MYNKGLPSIYKLVLKVRGKVFDAKSAGGGGERSDEDGCRDQREWIGVSRLFRVGKTKPINFVGC